MPTSLTASMRSRLDRAVRSPWFWLILLGYLLRLVLMPITGQHDVMFMPWMTRFINQGHLNLYSYLYKTFGEVAMQRPGIWAPYPYGFYALTAAWLAVLDLAGAVDLSSWNTIWGVSYPARSVFSLKLLYLPFDLGIGYIMFRTGGKVAFTLWAWSPAAIYTPFMMGQNDIYATFFAVAGVYAATKASLPVQTPASTKRYLDKWALLSSVFLGIGATFKVFPLMLLPPLVLTIRRDWKQRLALLGLGGLIYVVAALPFLGTPAFVSGVLLNPEGTSILRQINLFGHGVPPFPVSYVVLLAILLARREPVDVTQQAWFACLAVLALLFLWVPTPFYWLIWITPFVVAVSDRSRGLLLAWFGLQLGFALTLLAQHRELGASLPIHLASIFNVPNLLDTLAIAHPAPSRAFNAAWPLVNMLCVGSLLLASWHALKSLWRHYQRQSYGFRIALLGMLPTLLLLSGLAFNLFLARNLVSRNPWRSYPQYYTLSSADDTIAQQFSPVTDVITGVRLGIADASPTSTLNLCLSVTGGLGEGLEACDSSRASDRLGGRYLHFTFEDPVLAGSSENPAVEIQLEASGETVTLPYSTEYAGSMLQLGGDDLEGTLEISLLSQFNTAEALTSLIAENLLQDVGLLLLMAVVGVLVSLFLAVTLGVSQATRR